jgi:hypothetical protein
VKLDPGPWTAPPPHRGALRRRNTGLRTLQIPAKTDGAVRFKPRTETGGIDWAPRHPHRPLTPRTASAPSAPPQQSMPSIHPMDPMVGHRSTRSARTHSIPSISADALWAELCEPQRTRSNLPQLLRQRFGELACASAHSQRQGSGRASSVQAMPMPWPTTPQAPLIA